MRYLACVLSFIFLSTFNVHAQQAVPATGGEATGSGGTSSYTVGQVVYTVNSSSDGSVAQGVQQPYEISIANVTNENSIQIEISAYPNPTTNMLTLKVETSEFTNVNFQLVNSEGRLIERSEVNAVNSSIDMEALPKAVYFLNISKDNEVIKTFKIIKN